MFEGNDLPGVMLSTAARRLINLYAVKPGKRAVVFTANDEGLAAAADLDRVGVKLLAVVDARAGGELVRAKGAGELNSVEFAGGLRYECDLLVTAVGWTAPTLLVNMSGDRPHYHEISARFVPGGNLPPNVLATGGLVGDGPLPTIVEHGRAVGAVAAARAGDVSDWRRPPASRYDPPDPVGLEPAPHPSLFQARTHGVVDYSEDVSSKDLVSAVKEGYDSVELLKRYTTATMGPTQGKLETVNTVAVLAQATGRSMGETGTTVWRPPHVPISLGALAGRNFEPTRYSPIQPWHELHGATPIIAGQWIRPEHYGSAESEVRNVRENVGLIDVTPLGKLDMRGPDVPKLLSFLYVNKWSKLEVGAARYGVMCAEDGVVLDDGVTGHLGPDHYFTSTTSSGATAVHEWIESWLQTALPHLRVQVISMTNAYASINIAGPKSRELLRRVAAGIDLSPEAFAYMQVRTGQIAGVQNCLMWRIGFTGEHSYEIHVPAAYGLFVWEQLMDAGVDLGVAPFGLEAQRIMRLEKGHFIVGQDTDALTQAFSAGLDWLVKLDKEDFAGKPELAWEADPRTRAAARWPAADGPQARAARGEPDHLGPRHHRGSDHLEPLLTDPRPRRLSRLRLGSTGRARDRSYRPPARRAAGAGAGDGTACPLRPGGEPSSWLTTRPCRSLSNPPAGSRACSCRVGGVRGTLFGRPSPERLDAPCQSPRAGVT